MRNWFGGNLRKVIIAFVALVVAFFVGFAGWLMHKPANVEVTKFRDREVERPWPISDLAVDRNYRYYDWHTCKSGDGSLLADWHFTGADRSLRNQLTPVAEQVLNDSSLPRGYIRIHTNAEKLVEGHGFGGGVVVQYNGPRRSLSPIEVCGPERGVSAK